ncbi:MAG: formate dehydrogenase subunit gamma [Cypionkella sp.]|nr:formate dehydrogenase subunit gamma [Cypionkella sp.]
MLDTATLTARIDEILANHAGREGPLLPILHDIQAEYGHIPQGCLPQIALALNISRAEVHGVVSFYHDFREVPTTGRHVVKLCRAEACQALGADGVAAHIRAKLGIDWHDTTTNGAVTLEPVFCLGLCACGPAAMVDGKLLGRVDAAKIDTILGDLA